MNLPKQLSLDFGPHQSALDAQAANDAQIELSSFKAREREKFYRSNAWRRLRGRVLATHGARCKKCGCTSRDARIDVDHIIPRSIAPELALCLPNLQVLCEACHESKTYLDALHAARWRTTIADRRSGWLG